MGSAFLVFDDGIINVDDISTVIPISTGDAQEPSWVKVTFKSKGTSLDLNVSLKEFENRLQGIDKVF
jgi:hypothetical protein